MPLLIGPPIIEKTGLSTLPGVLHNNRKSIGSYDVILFAEKPYCLSRSTEIFHTAEITIFADSFGKIADVDFICSNRIATNLLIIVN